jgi:hypothetical protein
MRRMTDAASPVDRNLAVPVLATAAAWTVLHQVNAIWSDALAWSAGVTWLYLPAAIRLVAILLFGIRGALGLFVGSLITMTLFTDAPAGRVLAVAALSSLAPLIAVTLAARQLGIGRDLVGLAPRQLLVLVVVCAAVSVCLHNVYYWHVDLHDDLHSGLLPMFVGDVLGTLLVLYAVRGALRLRARLAGRRAR